MTAFTFTEFTTKGPGSQRFTIPPEVQRRAFFKWSRKKTGLRYASLGVQIDNEMGKVWGKPNQFSRAADRLVQKLRKADIIAWSGRHWTLTAAGEDLCRNIEAMSDI